MTCTLLFFFTSSGAQVFENLKNGGYTTYEEFINNSPKYECSFEVIRRTKAQIKAVGGHNYKIRSDNPSITKKMIKREIIGVYLHDTLYLNGMPLVNVLGYSKVEISGKYCYLNTCYPGLPKIQKELGLDDPDQYGYMFGAVGGAIEGAKMTGERVPLIYNIETGEKMIFAEANVSKLLDIHPDLKIQFESETNKSELDILKKYLIKLNELETK
jgi:hypothetical protein